MITTALWKVLRKRLALTRPNPAADFVDTLVDAPSGPQLGGHWHPTSVHGAAPCSHSGHSGQASQGGNSGYDSEFDTRMDAELLDSSLLQHGHRTVMQQVLRGRADPVLAPFSASYGVDANIVFDFRARLVFIDPQAQRQLRVHRELPQPAPGARAQGDAIVRELDETLWDIGIAAGHYPLLDAPTDWWRRPLRWAVDARVERYSRMPRHCDLARCLIDGPASPSELRRYARVGVADLRSFIQAGLMLGLLSWVDEDFATTQRQSH